MSEKSESETDQYEPVPKFGCLIRVDNVTQDTVEGYWDMRSKRWLPLDWLDAKASLMPEVSLDGN